MFRIRRFSVISTANTVAIMYFIGLLIVLIPVVLILSITSVTFTDASGQESTIGAGAVGGLVLLIIVPILYGLVAWVGTALFCLLYNLTARFTGGMGVDVWRNLPDSVAAPPPATAPPSYAAPPPPG
jgi:hypothetical protein